MASALAGCHSSRNAVEYDSIYAERGGNRQKPDKPARPRPGTDRPQNVSGTAAGVIDAARDWLGAPYVYGGNSRRGTDCSGLTCMAYEKGAGIKLPRSSREQAEYGSRISRDELRPGDLVFFTNKRGGGRINHVAIYIGDNKIIHATTSQGVVVTDLDDYYWRSHYFCSGRVL